MNIVEQQWARAQGCYMFRDDSGPWRRSLVQHIMPTMLLARDHLYEEGDAPSQVSILASGHVQLHCKRLRWHKTQGPAAVLSAPDVCGEYAALREQPHQFSAQVCWLAAERPSLCGAG